MPLVKVYDAATVFKYLNGIVNVYKPAGMKMKHVKTALIHNLCRGGFEEFHNQNNFIKKY